MLKLKYKRGNILQQKKQLSSVFDSIHKQEPKRSSTPFNFPLRKLLPRQQLPKYRKPNKYDWDGDGVKNKRDCQPRNPFRQDWNIQQAKMEGHCVQQMSPKNYFAKTETPFPSNNERAETRFDKYHDLDTDKHESILKLKGHIENPNKQVRIPFVGERYHDHEGRHRAYAAHLAGQETIPVSRPPPESWRTKEVQKKLMKKRFSDAGKSYHRQWEDRFKKPFPQDLMDLKTRKHYKEALVEEGAVEKDYFEEEPKAVYKYEVRDEHKKVAGPFTSRKRASHKVDKLDTEHGGYKYHVKQVESASLEKQEEWKNKSEVEKDIDRITEEDTDGDNVPDEYDCEPENEDKQDSQLYLSQRPEETPPLYVYNIPEKNIYIGNTKQSLREEDFPDAITHEEIHKTLSQIGERKASSALDSISQPSVADRSTNKLLNVETVGRTFKSNREAKEDIIRQINESNMDEDDKEDMRNQMDTHYKRLKERTEATE